MNKDKYMALLAFGWLLLTITALSLNNSIMSQNQINNSSIESKQKVYSKQNGEKTDKNFNIDEKIIVTEKNKNSEKTQIKESEKGTLEINNAEKVTIIR